jgi:hypothetical protein
MIGFYQTDVFAEAAATDSGLLKVNFISGEITGGSVSRSLIEAVSLYKSALPTFSARHGLKFDEITQLEACYGTDRVYGPHFSVTVEAKGSKRSTVQYAGIPGRRAKRKLR